MDLMNIIVCFFDKPRSFAGKSWAVIEAKACLWCVTIACKAYVAGAGLANMTSLDRAPATDACKQQQTPIDNLELARNCLVCQAMHNATKQHDNVDKTTIEKSMGQGLTMHNGTRHCIA